MYFSSKLGAERGVPTIDITHTHLAVWKNVYGCLAEIAYV